MLETVGGRLAQYALGSTGSGCLPAALLGWQDSLVPNPCRARGIWVSPHHGSLCITQDATNGKPEWQTRGEAASTRPGHSPWRLELRTAVGDRRGRWPMAYEGQCRRMKDPKLE